MKLISPLLRVSLILVLAAAGLGVGIRLTPRLARWTGDGGRRTEDGRWRMEDVSRATQPDWGGGRLRKLAVSSEQLAAGAATPDPLTPSWEDVSLRQKSGNDYALTMPVPLPGPEGRSGLFELPSSASFRKQLFPGEADAEAPAADIPLYPKSSCQMQVGHGTACFVGFYLTPDSVETVRSFYVRVLVKLGWQRVAAGGRRGKGKVEMSKSGPCHHDFLLSPLPLETFAKPDEDRTVIVQLRKQDSVTTRIGLVAMASGGSETKDAGRRTVVGPRSPVSFCNERK